MEQNSYFILLFLFIVNLNKVKRFQFLVWEISHFEICLVIPHEKLCNLPKFNDKLGNLEIWSFLKYKTKGYLITVSFMRIKVFSRQNRSFKIKSIDDIWLFNIHCH